MALQREMKLQQMLDFLNEELLPQTKQEIEGLIHPTKKTGGYFVVTRQILCMTDFLGAVYSGYPRKERVEDLRQRKERISTGKKAQKFIKAFFEPKNTYKKSTVETLYQMYRHGLVHLYQPRILKYKNGSLNWFIYKGNRHQDRIIVNEKITVTNVDHLKIIQLQKGSKQYFLAICIDSLFEDFSNSIEKYKKKLQFSKQLQTNWRTAVNAICTPK